MLEKLVEESTFGVDWVRKAKKSFYQKYREFLTEKGASCGVVHDEEKGWHICITPQDEKLYTYELPDYEEGVPIVLRAFVTVSPRKKKR